MTITKFTQRFISFALSLVALSASAQISTTVTMSGSPIAGSPFGTLSSAITAVNGLTISGPVEVNMGADQAEILTGPIVLTATGTAVNPITIQKVGTGANPKLIAYSGTSAGTSGSAAIDGMFILSGSDYVTIDKLDLTENTSNTTATTQMEVGFGLFKANASDGCQHDIIQGCSTSFLRASAINGASWTGSTSIASANAVWGAVSTLLVPTSVNGTNSYNLYTLNNLNGGSAGIQSIGYLLDLTNALCDQQNNYTNNTISDYGNATTNSVHGIIMSGAANYFCSYNTISSAATTKHTGTINGIFNANGNVGGNGVINNNIISIYGGGTTQNIQGVRVQAGTSTATITISENEITNSTYTTCTTGTFFGILTTGSAGTYNVMNNIIDNNSITGATNYTGQVYMISMTTGSPTNINVLGNSILSNSVMNGTITSATGAVRVMDIAVGANVLVRDNIIDGFTRQNGVSTSTVGNLAGIYCLGGSLQNSIKNNTINNITYNGSGTGCPMIGIGTGVSANLHVDSNNVSGLYNNKTTGTSNIYGIYDGAGATSESYTYNTVSNIVSLGSTAVYGMNFSTTAGTREISNNLISGLSSNGSLITGVLSSLSTPTISKNKIYNLSSTAAVTTISGIALSSVSATGATIQNNYIGDLKAPNVSSTSTAVRGINITASTASTSFNVSYNTIYLNASSIGANFSSAGIYHTFVTAATDASLQLRNNLIINNSTASGSGKTIAFQRSASTNLNNYSTLSNNNLFYAGNPSASNLIYTDGTNNLQTILDLRNFVSPRESSSLTENPSFLSTIGSNINYLHVDASIPTQIESNATPLATSLNDYDGDVRNASTPDIGADEFNGTTLVPCSSAPSASTINGISTLCAGNATTLSLSSNYSDYGISYQWYSGTVSGVYTNTMSNAATQATGALSSTTYYQCVITCAYSGLSYTTPEFVLTVQPLTTNTTTDTACNSYTWSVNGVTYTASGIYTYTTACETEILDLTINTCSSNSILNLTCFIQGYLDATNMMATVLQNQGEPSTLTGCDSIDVELHSAISPYTTMYSTRTVLHTDGTAACSYPSLSGNYYIAVKHRNALQTWSALPVAFGPTTTYDFSTSASQAYGSNQVQVSATGVWAFYSGDVIVDENMDLLDIGAVETDVNNFGYGYLSSDLNGDGNVDLLDFTVLEANVNNFVFATHP